MGYYILNNSVKEGPYELSELSSKNITSHTKVWKVGLTEWKPAIEIPELSQLLSELPPDVPVHLMPKTWLVESIIVTVMCCLPFGVMGIIKASKVEQHYFLKEYDLAEEYAVAAKKWTIIGCISGLVLCVLYFCYWCFQVCLVSSKIIV